ncbi:tRNA guanosine(34) transglycosylase Tgt [Conexibacter sp. SYSU D00693]|uniref:tRNA guanosine(34) transglycosylase Tgt n=1 Tax=Conexibacter sp. SYSU D00693 TaxID=2812560 RepID=UPI00196A9D45|nr:tRNA guanosine(34) transglycosylase Tgt [Conexibacter sp. SYSU D00693]
MAPLEILKRDPGSQARAGVLRTAHGEVRTPGFVPLATKATVRGLVPQEVRDLGFDIVLGNTFHLFLDPGHARIAHFGGLHRFMGWEGPIITDSGGFQVFSMGYGTVADEVKGRASHGAERHGKVLDISEDGVTFRSYLDGSSKFLAPETSMEVQAALGSDLALVFDECTPFNVPRDYTARSTERTHRWLDRCLDWHDAHGPEHQLVYGIVQGGVFEDLRVESTQAIAASRCTGIAIGGSLGADKPQIYEVTGWATRELGEDPRPRHLLGIGDVDDLVVGVGLGIDTFDCAMPTRLGRHGMALVPDPERRWRFDLTAAKYADDDRPVFEGCPCPTCAAGHTRGYLRYLLKSRELTGMRLITVHNLAFVSRLMARLRQAIVDGRLAEEQRALLEGAAP